MSDIHQSYEDFRLDALLQYDLADDEEENDAVDSESVHSGTIDEAAFDDLYASIPEVIYDDDNARMSNEALTRASSLRDVTKRIRNVSSRKIIPNRKTDDEAQNTPYKQPSGLLRSVSMILRPKRGKSKRFASKEKNAYERGIKRNISSKTEGTVSSFEDVVVRQSDDDLSCSVCYLDEEEDDDNSSDGYIDSRNKKFSSSASSSSEVFADDLNDTEKDNNNSDEACKDKLHCSFASHSAALADACYDIILNNNSTDTAISLDIDGCDSDDDTDDDSNKAFTTNDPMLNRSLPIIESLGLQDLFFDDYKDELVDRCQRSVASASSFTGSNTCSRHRRPYTICDF